MKLGNLLTGAEVPRRYAVSTRMGSALVKCKIERSPFSDERIFTLMLPDGREHIGTASYIYFYYPNGHKVGKDEPVQGKMISGKVDSIIVKDEDGTYLLSLPDGSVVSVPKSAVKMSKEAFTDVSVQP